MKTSNQDCLSLISLSHLLGSKSKQFEILADSLPQICYLVDLNGNSLWFNKRFYEYTGKTAEERNNGRWELQVHPDDLPNTRKAWQKALETQQPFEFDNRLLGKNGEYRWFLARGVPVSNDEGQVIGWLGTVTDIEDTRRTKDEILTLIESIDEGFLAVDKNWKITQVNSLHINITGIPREKQMGADLFELYFSTPESQKSEYCSVYRTAMADRVICKFEDFYSPLDLWTAVHVYPKEDGGLAIFYRDITEEKKAQATLLSAKEESERANQLKSSFLTNMSHEIRTPLASIMGYAEILQDESLASADRKRFLDMIVRNGVNLSRIIDDILDLSKVESGHLELESLEVSIDQLLHDVMSLFREQAKSKGISLRMKVDSTVPTKIKTDPTRLRQILVNLVGNAIKFTSEGGIVVQARAELRENRMVRIITQVTDTGIGISEEQLPKLFTPFTQADNSTTRRYGGTGLGLTLSKKLAQVLNGDLRIVESKLNQGTTFELQFISESAVEDISWNHASSARLESRIDLNHLNILLAEDAPDSQELIKYVLTTHGANVQVASNGAEALQLARENKFDVVLMDVQMPELDGYEVTRTLRAENYNRPIIALTAHAMIEERKKSEAAGCDGHITKPLNFIQLLSAVKEITTAH